VIIAHRLATISLADRVVLVENGAVAAMGRHTDLLENEPRYAEVLARVFEETPDDMIDDGEIDPHDARPLGGLTGSGPTGEAL